MSPKFPDVIKRVLAFLLATFVVGGSPVIAANTSATVTEAVNDVSHGSAQMTGTAAAPTGTQIEDGEYLKTGVKSRAELALADKTVTRMGANTVFNYSVANNEIDLQEGTILFSKPKNAGTMTIKTASVTAAIVGTTGFAQLHGKVFLFGLIEGHATVIINGTIYHSGAGDIVKFTPGAPPLTFSFNIPALVKTSPLITRFHSQLPNQPFIDKAVAEYDDLAARGFIQPPKEPFFLTTFEGAVPSVPVAAHDSAGSALQQFNNPPPPPPPPSMPSFSGS